jgi:hypothetical protein
VDLTKNYSITTCYVTIKIGSNIEAMKVTFQAHNSREKGDCSKIEEKGVAHRGRKILVGTQKEKK